MSVRWFCLRTAPRQESLATFFVEALGFRVAAPTCVVLVKNRARQPWKTGTRRVKMFPSYLFVQFDPSVDPWRPIATLPGVRQIFGTAPERPTPLPDDEIEAILARPETALEAIAERTRISTGVRTRVTSGPFEGHEGVCCRSEAERVTILLTLLGMPRPIAFAAEQVEAIE